MSLAGAEVGHHGLPENCLPKIFLLAMSWTGVGNTWNFHLISFIIISLLYKTDAHYSFTYLHSSFTAISG